MPAFIWGMVASVVLVTITVLVHYESLRLISDQLIPRLRLHPRHEMVYVIFGVFFAHTLEVWIFAGGYALLEQAGIGQFHGHLEGNALDYLYFSAVTYTTLGFGDIYVYGPLRLVSGVEGLTGLLMIGWSASYTYLSMEKLWQRHAEHVEKKRRR
jgi:hypothetical protein